MIFEVDYLIKNKEAWEAEKRTVPSVVVSEDFDAALKTAKKFESTNISLLKVSPAVQHNAIVVARGYKGLSYEKESA